MNDEKRVLEIKKDIQDYFLKEKGVERSDFELDLQQGNEIETHTDVCQVTVGPYLYYMYVYVTFSHNGETYKYIGSSSPFVNQGAGVGAGTITYHDLEDLLQQRDCSVSATVVARGSINVSWFGKGDAFTTATGNAFFVNFTATGEWSLY